MWKTIPTTKGLAHYTTDEAPGAFKNGTRIVKVFSEKGDTNPVGTLGVVIGSLASGNMVGYFVKWETSPDMPVFVAAPKINKATMQ